MPSPTDSRKTSGKQRTARYPNLQNHREELGWSIQELLAKLQGASISEKSIRRLEEGRAIRVANANKVFNAISIHYPEKLIREEQIKVV